MCDYVDIMLICEKCIRIIVWYIIPGSQFIDIIKPDSELFNPCIETWYPLWYYPWLWETVAAALVNLIIMIVLYLEYCNYPVSSKSTLMCHHVTILSQGAWCWSLETRAGTSHQWAPVHHLSFIGKYRETNTFYIIDSYTLHMEMVGKMAPNMKIIPDLPDVLS